MRVVVPLLALPTLPALVHDDLLRSTNLGHTDALLEESPELVESLGRVGELRPESSDHVALCWCGGGARGGRVGGRGGEGEGVEIELWRDYT